LCLYFKTSLMNIPSDLLYSNDHEWVKLDGEIATIGITDFAQRELGDIVYIEIETVGDTLEREQVFGTVEAVKTVSDLFMPIGGEVIEFNTALEDTPEAVNDQPYELGWMIKIKMDNSAQLKHLLSADKYKQFIQA
jgi:glycine cleavage system H protein